MLWAVGMFAIAACDDTTTSSPAVHIAHRTSRIVNRATPALTLTCPQAAGGHGYMGACAPSSVLSPVPRAQTAGRILIEDLSNNDPSDCGSAIKAAGFKGLVVKLRQGSFVDRTGPYMVASARAAGLATGGYDFDQDYTVAEAKAFVEDAQIAGLYPTTRNTLPLTFDVEYGDFSISGLLAQIRYVESQGYRVDIYTGAWYWGPHAGCRWPTGIDAWLAGYPVAFPLCGLPTGLYVLHQFTDTPHDQSVYLGSAWPVFTNAVPKPSAAQRARWKRALAASKRALAIDQKHQAIQAQRVRYFTAQLAG